MEYISIVYLTYILLTDDQPRFNYKYDIVNMNDDKHDGKKYDGLTRMTFEEYRRTGHHRVPDLHAPRRTAWFVRDEYCGWWQSTPFYNSRPILAIERIRQIYNQATRTILSRVEINGRSKHVWDSPGTGVSPPPEMVPKDWCQIFTLDNVEEMRNPFNEILREMWTRCNPQEKDMIKV